MKGAPKNQGLDPFSDPIDHFGAPWWPFMIFEVLIERMIESKHLFSESWSECPITEGLNSFQTLSVILVEAGG